MSVKQQRSVSLRMDSKFDPYLNLLANANIQTSEGIRILMENAMKRLSETVKNEIDVKIKFHWNEPPNYSFPENVGCLKVTVNSNDVLEKEALHKIVFQIPEFFTETAEPFRIDSYHFHRVDTSRIAIYSSKAQKHTLAFRLIEQHWRAGIFNYEKTFDKNVLEREITERIEKHIESTISAYIIDQLPDDRILNDEELENLNEILLQYVIDNSDKPFNK